MKGIVHSPVSYCYESHQVRNNHFWYEIVNKITSWVSICFESVLFLFHIDSRVFNCSQILIRLIYQSTYITILLSVPRKSNLFSFLLKFVATVNKFCNLVDEILLGFCRLKSDALKIKPVNFLCQKIHCIYQFSMFSLASSVNDFGFSNLSQRSFVKFDNLLIFLGLISVSLTNFYHFKSYFNSLWLLKKATKILPRTVDHVRQNTFTVGL